MPNSTSSSIKVTYASVLAKVIDGVALNEVEIEKAKALLESIQKKSANKGERKPTAKQIENVGLYEQIKDYLANVGKATFSDIAKNLFANEVSGQRISAILRPHLNEEIIRTEEKRVAYFSLAE